MDDLWLVKGVIPVLGGVVFLGLARRPPSATSPDGTRRGARVIQAVFAILGVLWLLGGTLYLLSQFVKGS